MVYLSFGLAKIAAFGNHCLAEQEVLLDNEDLRADRSPHQGCDVVPLEASSRLSNRASSTAAFAPPVATPPAKVLPLVCFDRRELSDILRLYGQRVAEGEWRDYAIDFQRDRAVFSVFKRSSEMPVYRIEKDPRLARKQGAYAVVSTNGMILKRGHDLRQVLKVLETRKHLRLVD
ncbi:MAG: DUF2794 domain-containing protein [Rhizobiales bacterium]|nr:DUF2794 domain-containing protein [Hyphomicrobiales bacterium]